LEATQDVALTALLLLKDGKSALHACILGRMLTT